MDTWGKSVATALFLKFFSGIQIVETLHLDVYSAHLKSQSERMARNRLKSAQKAAKTGFLGNKYQQYSTHARYGSGELGRHSTQSMNLGKTSFSILQYPCGQIFHKKNEIFGVGQDGCSLLSRITLNQRLISGIHIHYRMLGMVQLCPQTSPVNNNPLGV